MKINVISIVGKTDSGKTTLIEKLIPELASRGIRVGTIKHDAHRFLPEALLGLGDADRITTDRALFPFAVDRPGEPVDAFVDPGLCDP